MDYAPAIFDKQLLLNDYMKYVKSYLWCPDYEALRIASEAHREIRRSTMLSSVISVWEAISLMEVVASPGYPWNKYCKSKREALDKYLDLIVFIVLQLMKTGKVHYVLEGIEYNILYWQTSPKGEIRTVTKLINPDPTKRKTRVFVCGCIISQIVSMMLSYNQNQNILATNREMWIKLGFTPFYGGWDNMSRKILNKEDPKKKLFDCNDVGHMEACLKEYVQEHISRLRYEGLINMNDDYENMFRFNHQNKVYSYLIDPEGNLIMKFGCNSSGGFDTLSDNCLALEWMHLYNCAKEIRSVQGVIKFYNTENLAILGDDSIIPHIPIFQNLQQNSLEIGFELKPEKPTGVLKDCSFTNCGFELINGKWLPRPNFDKIRASIYYNFKNKSWRFAYAKVNAYYVLSYYFPLYHQEAIELQRWILMKKDNIMKNFEGSLDDKLTYEAALSTRLEDSQIEFMWTGNEAYYENSSRYLENLLQETFEFWSS